MAREKLQLSLSPYQQKDGSGDGASSSMEGLRKGNLEGGFFSEDFERYVKRTLD
jgi:hypothetical protein